MTLLLYCGNESHNDVGRLFNRLKNRSLLIGQHGVVLDQLASFEELFDRGIFEAILLQQCGLHL